MLEIEIIHFDNVGNNEAEDFFVGMKNWRRVKGR